MIVEGKTLDLQHIALESNHGIITDIKILSNDPSKDLPFLAPGLIDLQVNGFNGVDYNSLPLEIPNIRKSLHSLYSQGVTKICPTIVTNSDDAIASLITTFAKAVSSDDDIKNSIVGLHLEGPFISPNDGARGAHELKYIRAPELRALKIWNKASQGLLKILTLSPEWHSGLTEIMSYCKANDINVSIGHTCASEQEIEKAINLGARMSTHLGNGCNLTIARHRNHLWPQLAEDSLWCGFIADGFHLPKSIIKIILKVKGDKALLTSDTTSFGGMQPGRYQAHIGGEVILTPEGKLHMASNEQLLAGSASSALSCIKFLIQNSLCTLSSAWKLASTNPADFLNLSNLGNLRIGNRADLVELREDQGNLQVLATYLQGKKVFSV